MADVDDAGSKVQGPRSRVGVYGITFPTLDVLSDVFAADSRLYSPLHVFDRHPISGSFQTIDIDVEIEALGNTFRKNCPHAGQSRQEFFDAGPGLLNSLHVCSLNLHADRRLDSCELHVETVLYRHCPGVREARELKL